MGTAVMDPTADDFSAFIDLPMDEQALANGLASPALPDPLEPWREFHPPIYRSDDPSESGVQSPGVQAKSPTDSKTIATPIVSASASSDVDEGRYRTHALYSVGPGVDGLYHCPFRPKENCPHEPNKLKCNYDKFIDSHLKPFRCKVDACAKQEFSSTACLLRHEREAHGMHGHGDRPHLCLYAGCDRNRPGSGFPRSYNLRDHMKRMHDWKDPAPPDRAVSGESNPKKPGARKRKAAGVAPLQSAVQRQRKTPAPPQRAIPPAAQVYQVVPAVLADGPAPAPRGHPRGQQLRQRQDYRRTAF